MFITNNSNYPIGLDLSDLSIKAVQLNKIRDKVKVQSVGKIHLPPGVLSDGEITDKEAIKKAIKELIDNPQFGKFSTDEVVACLPESKTFIKLIEVEKTPNDLKHTIESEIEKHVPMAINEIYYDWEIIEDLRDRQLILVGAAPQYLVNQYTGLLDEAKLSVVALEMEPIAVCRSLLAEENPKYNGEFNQNYAIIDIGSKSTCMTVYSRNTVLFTISMPISGEEITQKISKILQIDRDQAEKAKIICGLDEGKADGIIKDILSDTIKELVDKIQESIEFYNHHFPSWGPLNKIYICGGGANINNLDRIIREKLKIEAVRADILTNLGDAQNKLTEILTENYNLEIKSFKKQKSDKNKKVADSNYAYAVKDTSLTFATAVGLALRGLFVNKL